MGNLSTLSPDLRLEIARLAIDQVEDKRAERRNLSLVCRSMNQTCGPLLFRNHHLVMRLRKSWDHQARKYPSTTWDEAQFKLRLSRLRSKAAFVRNLTITDITRTDSKNSTSQPPNFAPEIMPQLIETLNKLSGLTSIYLNAPDSSEDPVTTIPLDLWKCIARLAPSTIKLNGWFKLAATDQDIPSMDIEKLIVSPYRGYSKSLTDSIHPTRLDIDYNIFHTTRPTDLLLKPVGPKIEHVKVEIGIGQMKFDKPLLDFSGVPNATVIVHLHFHVELKMHILKAWQSAKAALPGMFVEDLSGFDVRRIGTCEAQVYRSPDPDWTPARQEHIGGEARDRAEAERMRAHYAYKRELFWLKEMANDEDSS
ncbi:hypothetical protein D9615_007334 [Tricholomella constricta]|uniref:Uncharacterized protein n=1 Tax=Tricholomella constricta TaxID=117010 RepID=A0A8H5M182_9AGAR|nr:hypothetical protein D9615_007334 [Tricholomella constricta]